jgi:hypothetical protein
MLTAIIRWYKPQGRLMMNRVIEIYTDLTFGMLHAADDGASARRIAPSASASFQFSGFSSRQPPSHAEMVHRTDNTVRRSDWDQAAWRRVALVIDGNASHSRQADLALLKAVFGRINGRTSR